MKKQLIFALVALVLIGTACKKDVTCECTTVSNYTSTYTNAQGNTTTNANDPQTNTTTRDYKKVKKSKLKTLCGDQKSSYNSNSSSPDYSSTGVSTYETKCEIK